MPAILVNDEPMVFDEPSIVECEEISPVHSNEGDIERPAFKHAGSILEHIKVDDKMMERIKSKADSKNIPSSVMDK